ncbi:MAG: ferritin-like domain-containing protein, partial [Muribaculaceae bacterium]
MKTLDYIDLDGKRVENVIVELKQLLADFQVFYTNLRGFHWNIKGRGFFILHAKFEGMYNDASNKIDELAERILQLGGVAPHN